MNNNVKYETAVEQLEEYVRMIERIVPLVKQSLAICNFKQWTIELMEWHNEVYVYAINGVAEELYGEWIKIEPYIDMDVLSDEMKEALGHLFEEINQKRNEEDS